MNQVAEPALIVGYARFRVLESIVAVVDIPRRQGHRAREEPEVQSGKRFLMGLWILQCKNQLVVAGGPVTDWNLFAIQERPIGIKLRFRNLIFNRLGILPRSRPPIRIAYL